MKGLFFKAHLFFFDVILFSALKKGVSTAVLIMYLTMVTVSADTMPSRKLIWTVQGNVYHGSIVGRNRVDGLTGATPNTHGATIGVEYNLKGHFLQALITYGRTNQDVTYNLSDEGLQGKQNIKLHLLDIPIMYNFHFLKKPAYNRDNPRLIVSPGIFFSFLLHAIPSGDEEVTSDPSAFSSWASGIFTRVAFFPYPFKIVQPGLFLEFYRSFLPLFYDDSYFKENDISGQLGILNSGISLRF